MDYCSILFGKKLGVLTYQDIESFFKVGKEESDQLEFKSYAGSLEKNLPGLTKSICGFLNSKGGVIVLGAPKGSIPSGKTEKVFSGSLTPVKEPVEKDRLVSKISDRIIPLPQSIRIHSISGKSGETVVVFEIDESEYSPHQTEGVYYMRMDGQTRPAPHHYIEAQMKKIRFPNVEGYVKISRIKATQTSAIHGLYEIELEVQLHNWSPFENAIDATYILSIEVGEFVKGVVTKGYVGNQAYQAPPHAVLHYGVALREKHEFTARSEVTSANNNEINIRLQFSARNSPAKISTYLLNLSKNTGANWDNQVVVDRKENRSIKDIQDELGSNREKILLHALGRIPK